MRSRSLEAIFILLEAPESEKRVSTDRSALSAGPEHPRDNSDAPTWESLVDWQAKACDDDEGVGREYPIIGVGVIPARFR